jgi:hypothetical protein
MEHVHGRRIGIRQTKLKKPGDRQPERERPETAPPGGCRCRSSKTK